MANPPVPVDLNALQRTILENQRRDEPFPVVKRQQVVIDPITGRLSLGDAVSRDESFVPTEVPQGIFASAPTRLERDRGIVRQRFPPQTRELTVAGVTGWVYSIVDECNARYKMFAYHDGTLYQVKVVLPEVEGKYSPHNGHLFDDGRICFGPSGGLPALDQAYAKSVLWATGFTVYQQTGQFPFSLNNFQ